MDATLVRSPGTLAALKAWETRRLNAGASATPAREALAPSAGTLAALKAAETRRRNAGLSPERAAYLAKLRASMAGAIAGARRRQAERATPVAVTVTVEELMAKLAENDYRCAVTGLPFYEDDAEKSFGPSRPSLDRIETGGPYSADNVRIVYLGVNGLRGCGSDADVLRIARAIVARAKAGELA
ncbi:hypothetical protein [Paraburkholderia youngii]|uniref:Uncharacterized protein n=1 Tax=Paraburkholderia youngii TaxID=2782701 RepID=A0ABX2NQB9_9BURK|nr:hypothetical protein [Paraburkholderia youngii]NVI06393.1 hypothetical protein [Paraburkholderia youngii]